MTPKLTERGRERGRGREVVALLAIIVTESDGNQLLTYRRYRMRHWRFDGRERERVNSSGSRRPADSSGTAVREEEEGTAAARCRVEEEENGGRREGQRQLKEKLKVNFWEKVRVLILLILSLL